MNLPEYFYRVCIIHKRSRLYILESTKSSRKASAPPWTIFSPICLELSLSVFRWLPSHEIKKY